MRPAEVWGAGGSAPPPRAPTCRCGRSPRTRPARAAPAATSSRRARGWTRSPRRWRRGSGACGCPSPLTSWSGVSRAVCRRPSRLSTSGRRVPILRLARRRSGRCSPRVYGAGGAHRLRSLPPRPVRTGRAVLRSSVAPSPSPPRGARGPPSTGISSSRRPPPASPGGRSPAWRRSPGRSWSSSRTTAVVAVPSRSAQAS